MKAAELIQARREGVSFQRILRAVESGSESLGALANDQADFLEGMLSQVKQQVVDFEKAIQTEDIDAIKRATELLSDSLMMVRDSW